jgi:hypothetical protein
MRSKDGLGANPKVRFRPLLRLLRDLGVKLVVGYEGIIRGACPLDGAGPDAERHFRTLPVRMAVTLFLCDPTGDLKLQPRHRHYARLVARILLEVRAHRPPKPPLTGSAKGAFDAGRESLSESGGYPFRTQEAELRLIRLWRCTW